MSAQFIANFLLNSFLFSIAALISGAVSSAEFVRACYYGSWAVFREGQAKFEPEHYIPGLCTHLFYAFGWMNEDFSAKAYDPSDTANTPTHPKGNYERFTALKEYDPALKTILSFGGRSFPNKLFQAMLSSAENRHTFISTAISWVRRFDFDGIDIDWDNPDDAESKENFGIFLRELMEAAVEESRVGWERLLITVEVEGKREIIDRSYDIAAIADAVDQVHVKTFDFQFYDSLEPKIGFNAPLFGRKNESDERKKHWNVEDAVTYWTNGGVPASKILIGIPIFGRGWTLKDPSHGAEIGTPATASKPQKYTRSAGAAAYYEICVMLNSSRRFFDEETKSPFLIAHGNQWFSYDDQQSIRMKVEWLRQKGLGGTYIWAIDYDDFNQMCPNSTTDGPYPLIGTIAREIGGVGRLGLSVEKLMKKKNDCLSASSVDFGSHFCLTKFFFTFFVGIFLLLALSASFSCFFICFLFKVRRSRFSYGTAGFFMDIKAYLYFNPMKVHELDPTVIDIEKLIYSGPNSRVYFGRFRFAEAEFRPVVVKVPSKDAFRVQSIVAETRINAQLRHPRVVEYVGFYRDAFDDVRIVSEFMAGGDLHSFLVDKRNTITIGHIFNFIGQIAEGMEYLVQKRLIHRDLAARNCMLNEEKTSIKIADFGLSRHFNADANYASTSPARLPLRWMALECFDENGEILHQCKFNEKTDVWSFGVVVWECFARGAQPYGSAEFQRMVVGLKKHLVSNGMPNSAVADHHDDSTNYANDRPNCHPLINFGAIREGCRLARPEKCPQLLYDQLMLKCWAHKQELRPTFSKIREKLEEIFGAIIGLYPDTFIQIVQ